MQINVANYHACVTCVNSLRIPLSQLQANVINANAVVTAANVTVSALAANGCATTVKSQCLRLFQACPWDCTTWGAVPTLGESITGICVCNANGISGSCCLWTVPAGVSLARFQIWGAGSPSGGSACCGGSMFGGTGAYASVIVPVVEGCQYTVCAGGTTFNCNTIAHTTDITAFPGCASFVTGFNLNNVCAEGGEPSMFCWMKTMTGSSMTVCQLAGPAQWCAVQQFQTAPCFCATASNYCNGGNSNSLSTCIPFGLSCKTYYGNTNFSSANTTYCVYGMNGLFNSMYLDPNSYGCQSQQPIYGFTCGCVWIYTSGTCGGCICCAAINNIPGAGGWATHAMGGSCMYGSGGRAGLVCIQYR
jgi:hypothetical protein